MQLLAWLVCVQLSYVWNLQLHSDLLRPASCIQHQLLSSCRHAQQCMVVAGPSSAQLLLAGAAVEGYTLPICLLIMQCTVLHAAVVHLLHAQVQIAVHTQQVQQQQQRFSTDCGQYGPHQLIQAAVPGCAAASSSILPRPWI